jgi:uncharacterized lipoprotein YddW (UPF0748 family)
MEKKSIRLILYILISFFIFQLQLSAKLPDSTKTRGVWMWGSVLSSQDPQAIVNKLSDNYVNEVYLLVKGTAGTMTAADKLTGFVTKAHAKNIKIQFWYAVNQDDVYYASHSDACIYHNPKPSAGYPNPYPMSDSRINLLYPGYKEYVLNNIKYLITNFDCDGIHLDYIRYAHLVYSFDKYHLQKAASLGCDTSRLLNLFRNNYDYYAVNDGFVTLYTNRDPDAVKWVNMRKEIVKDYIKSIKDTIEKIKPSIELTASFMPEGAYVPDYADVYYSQNYTLNSPLLKKICPMAYFKDYGKTTGWLQTVTENAIQLVDPKCKIITGTQAYGGVTALQLNEQISYALKGGAFGAAIFKYEDITADQWSAVKTIFEKMTDVKEDHSTIPAEFELKQNYPNPFNPTTNISYNLPKESIINLSIFDELGREVTNLISSQKQSAGKYNVTWNGTDSMGKIVPTGLYFYRISTDDLLMTRKMIFMK